jgi:hypothetical protein
MGYQGKIRKTALVQTNDPDADTLRIGLEVSVDVPIALNPRYVLLTGVEGKITTKVIDITAGLDKPLQLEPVTFNLEGKIGYRIVEVEQGRKFKIYFETLPQSKGNFNGFLNLKTNYDEKPNFNIRISGRLSKP